MAKKTTGFIQKKYKKFINKFMKKYDKSIGKYLNPITKYGRYVFKWRVFWSLVFIFLCSTIYFPTLGNGVIEFVTAIKPPNLVKLPANAKFDEKTTLEYKKEKLTVVRTNLGNVFQLVERDLGIKEDVKKDGHKVVSASKSLPVIAVAEKNIAPDNDNQPAKSDFGIVKENLSGAFKAYLDMLTVRIVTIGNKPVMIGDNGEIVPYDKTDRILQWAKYIEATAKKYHTDPAIIAGIIEQESGGDPGVVSHSGAIGLMQLMPRTAEGLGVNPYDPAQNIDGGTRYFLFQYKAFGNVVQALAAYNAGPNNVRNGDYLYIPETQGYITKVPRLIQKYHNIFINARRVNATAK